MARAAGGAGLKQHRRRQRRRSPAVPRVADRKSRLRRGGRLPAVRRVADRKPEPDRDRDVTLDGVAYVIVDVSAVEVLNENVVVNENEVDRCRSTPT